MYIIIDSIASLADTSDPNAYTLINISKKSGRIADYRFSWPVESVMAFNKLEDSFSLWLSMLALSYIASCKPALQL